MRISDIILSSDFVHNFTNAKSKVDELQTQIATGNKIQQPSDSPDGTANLIGWNSQLDQLNTYSDNIDKASSFVQDTTSTMESIQTEVTNVLTKLGSLNSTTSSANLTNVSDQINQSLQTILGLANNSSDGKFIFGGTDFSTQPFGFTSDNTSIEVKPNDISGVQNIRTSQNISQQINMSGTEVFGTIVSGSGNIDSSTTIGSTVNSQSNIYDALGNQYTFDVNYTKTAANTYSMTYDIKDGGGTSVLSQPPAANTLVFNATSGVLQTVNNQSPSLIHIKIPNQKIDFSFDASSVKEASSASSLAFSANQKTDIFNTLISIRNSLQAGNLPTQDQMKAISDFNSRMLDNISKDGNNTNQLSNAKSLIGNQQTQLKTLMTNVQGVDMAQAVMDLQNQQNLLQMSYKLAATVTAQSLLNYM
ncbi:MAG: flagellar hook-associated protein FlgL [Bacteroidetes bacterium]|nr:flagellar hook-associated protein FlgL [Bacteroidota bacterium]